jgi:hypothetical protein
VPAPYFFPVMGVLSLAWFGSRVAATARDVAERFAAEARPAWPLSRTAYV